MSAVIKWFFPLLQNATMVLLSPTVNELFTRSSGTSSFVSTLRPNIFIRNFKFESLRPFTEGKHFLLDFQCK